MDGIAPLPVVVPLAGAAITLGLNSVLSRRAVQALALVTALAEVGLAAALVYQARSGTLVYWFGGWTPRHGVALGVSFTIDQLGAGAALLAGVVVTAAIATTGWTIADGEGFVHTLLLTLLAAMAGFCLTGDLFNMFVFFELMAVSALALAAYQTRHPAALRSALNFAITNTIGAFLVLVGVALLYRRTGALNLAQIGRQLATTGRSDRVAALALATLMAGFLIRAAVVPFHFWLVDTASSGPVPLAMILAGALDTLGIYAVARVYWTVFATPLGGGHHAVQALLIGLGVLSAGTGAALAVSFRDPRRRLAFVMVAHTGILLIGVGVLTARGMAAAAIYGVGDGTVNAALFVGIALLGPAADARPLPSDRPARTAAVPRPVLAGHPARPVPSGQPDHPAPDARRSDRPASPASIRAGQALLVVGGLATAGLPLFATGLGMAAVEDAAGAAGDRWVTPVIVLVAALTGAAILDIARRAAPRHPAVEDNAPVRWVGAGSVAVVLLALSASAALIGGWAAAAGSRFVDTAAYQARVLGGLGVLRPPRPAAIGLSGGGALLDGAAVVGAVLVAFALSRPTARGWGRSTAITSVRAASRRLHDGSIGDSVTWATVGTAAIAVIFASSVR